MIVSCAYLELLIPLRASAAFNSNTTRFRVNPDISVDAYENVGVVLDSEVRFREDMDGITLIPDLCTISACTVAPL